METIKLDQKVTEYFAKKQALQEALLYFRKNKKQSCVRIMSPYSGGMIDVSFAREALNSALGYSFVENWAYATSGSDENFNHKDHYLRVFEAGRC